MSSDPDAWAIVNGQGKVVVAGVREPSATIVAQFEAEHGECSVEPLFLGKILGEYEFDVRLGEGMEMTFLQKHWNNTSNLTLKAKRDKPKG